MPRYSEQFKRDSVALYEINEDLSMKAASAELGINRASLHTWLKQYGTEVPVSLGVAGLGLAGRIGVGRYRCVV
ncbi:transposase [Trueperella pecoris]|uniref:Transposase n=1 Tax=Trueperella pecoris TaxID=2733571 RepID=A0A7M1QYC0_9ACTO|nr:transposase [Trueperella pecoris]QOR47019.1 transposase [Trueperella pecoris]